MAGFNTIKQIRDLEEKIHKLGFRWGHTRDGGFNNEFGDVLALFPRDDNLPIYNRDAQIFNGSLNDLEHWLRGVTWAREYDKIMKVSGPKKREQKEQDLKEEQMLYRLKNEKVTQIPTLPT